MGIISPRGFVEGNVSSFGDLNDVDTQWTKLGSNVNGLNVREEGLDRRVIKTSSWMPQISHANSDYYASGTCDLAFPQIHGHPVGWDVPVISSSIGGVGAGKPSITATWDRSETQAIMVRCSFRVFWNCSKIMTSGEDKEKNAAASPLEIRLVRKNNSTDDDAPDERIHAYANWELSKAFGHSAAHEKASNIEFKYDRRSNVSGSVTLCDLVTPDDIWDGGSNFEFNWRLTYYHPLAAGAVTPGSTHVVGATIQDINFYATPFNR